MDLGLILADCSFPAAEALRSPWKAQRFNQLYRLHCQAQLLVAGGNRADSSSAHTSSVRSSISDCAKGFTARAGGRAGGCSSVEQVGARSRGEAPTCLRGNLCHCEQWCSEGLHTATEALSSLWDRHNYTCSDQITQTHYHPRDALTKLS